MKPAAKSSKKNAPWIVFDFDGTLADTLEPLIKTANKLSKLYGYPEITKPISELRGIAIKQLIKELGVPFFKLPFLVRQFNELLHAQMKDFKPIEGMVPVLQELKKEGYQLGIITSNLEKNVQAFLKHHHIEHFDFIHSDSSVFGKHRVIKRFLDAHDIDPDSMIYIGDETRDIEAAKKNKISMIAVTWGFNTNELLQQYQPTYIVDQPKELIAVIKQFSNT